MKTIFNVLLAVLFFFPFATAQNQEKTFTVSKGGNLIVETSHGNIVVTSTTGDEVKVIAKNVDQGDLSDLNMTKEGNKVIIKFKGEDSEKFSLEINAPQKFNFDISTGGGNVSFKDDIDGMIKITTGGGNVAVKNISGKLGISSGGGNIKTGDLGSDAVISSGGGEISVNTIKGKLELSTGGGNVSVKDISMDAEVSTAGGNISIGNIGGKAEITSGGGNISIKSISGNTEVSTGGGNISLSGVSGKVEATTGGGNISLKDIKGSVEATTGAGNIYAELDPLSGTKSELTTGVGKIEIKIPGNAKTTITATTYLSGWNDNKDQKKIKSDFEPFSTNEEKGGKELTIVYKLNNGGSEIMLETGMGEIEIRKMK